MLPNVEYRGVPGFPGYRVGSDGSVWSSKKINGASTEKWKQRKVRLSTNGYYRLNLCNNGIIKTVSVHRLILLAFVGPQKEGQVSRHLNGIRTDNRSSNLVYGTQKENVQDGIAHGTHVMGERHGNSVLTDNMVREIRQSTKGTRMSYGERKAIAGKLGVATVTVSRVKGFKCWKHVV